jgi:iron complex outermembrane recepter protein
MNPKQMLFPLSLGLAASLLGSADAQPAPAPPTKAPAATAAPATTPTAPAPTGPAATAPAARRPAPAPAAGAVKPPTATAPAAAPAAPTATAPAAAPTPASTPAPTPAPADPNAPVLPSTPTAPPVEAPAPEAPAAPVPIANGTLTGTITASDSSEPLIGATVSLSGTAYAAITDAEGRFTIEAPPGDYKLVFELTAFRSEERAVTVTAGAPTTLALTMAQDQEFEEVIMVVGSRTPRSNGETTAPVDILTTEEIARSPQLETSRMLASLAPSFNSTPQTVADGSDHVNPASLRGLGPDQVLVLVNGKRRHKTALMHVNGTFGRGTVGVDLNAIPSSSIKRIEILRDGAASQYGSDAIAGVINIVLKDITDLVEITTATGITGEGDGAQIKTSANYGFKLGDKGFINITGEFIDRQDTNRAGTYTGRIFSNDADMDAAELAARGLTADDFEMKIGDSAATVAMTSYNLEYPLNDNATFYSFGGLTHRNGTSAGFYRYPKDVTQVVPELYPLGFLPEIVSTVDDLSIGAGLRGKKAGWDLDFSVVHGRNSFQFNIENTNNASLGTRSPTTFDAGTLGFAQTVGNFDLVRPLDVPQLKSLALVLGSEFRLENYSITAGEEASYSLGPVTVPNSTTPKAPGSQVFPGFQPSNEVDRYRDNIGLYAGFESELKKGISVDVGGRFENYSDFGRSLIGKAAARAEVHKHVALRGAVSTGFRAPSLQQFWFNNVSTVFVPVGPAGTLEARQVLTANNLNPVTKAFGIPDLQEEKSLNFSAGIALKPIENLSITVDGYYIAIDDRIVLTGRFTNANPNVAAILAPFPSVSQVQFFSNAVDTATQGLDVVADYSMDVGEGSLNLTASANFTRTNVEAVNIPGSLSAAFADDAAALRTSFFGRQEENRLEDTVPRVRGTLSGRYTLGLFSALLRANYYGSVRSKPDLSVNDEEFGAKRLFDVDLGYQVTKNLRLTLGAENLLNTFPDKQEKAANTSLGRFPYSRNVSQFGQNGGFYYGKLQLTFF